MSTKSREIIWAGVEIRAKGAREKALIAERQQEEDGIDARLLRQRARRDD
jgi:hypothetical protein